MTDETESTQVELQSAYDMIRRDATAHISAMKARQWTITHYALLIFGALFYFAITKVVASDVGKFLVIIGVVVVLLMWLYLMDMIAGSMKEKRQRLNRLYKSFPQQAKCVYGEISCRRESLAYDIEIAVFQGLVLLVSSGIVIFYAITEYALSAPS